MPIGCSGNRLYAGQPAAAPSKCALIVCDLMRPAGGALAVPRVLKMMEGSGLSFRGLLSIVLVLLLACPIQLLAQSPETQTATPPARGAASNRDGLRILVLEGQNAVNSIASKSAVNPVIQVLDILGQPVQGVNVMFEVSPTGPGGTFGDKPTAAVQTDYQGQATAAFTPNGTAGSFVIKVTASTGTQKTETRIHQTNDRNVKEAMLAQPSKPWYKNWKWWAVIGAGAGAGVAAAVILTNRDQTSTITIAPGGVTIGGPR